MEHLLELNPANLLILVGIVFLVVGVFGKVGGFLGNIFGQIQAGDKARILSGVLGVALIATGIYMHASEPAKDGGDASAQKTAVVQPAPSVPQTSPTPAPSAAQTPASSGTFAETWINTVHSKKNGIEKFQIQQTGSQLTVQGFTPEHEDLGTQQTALDSSGSATVALDKDEKGRKFTLKLDPSGGLQVRVTKRDGELGPIIPFTRSN